MSMRAGPMRADYAAKSLRHVTQLRQLCRSLRMASPSSMFGRLPGLGPRPSQLVSVERGTLRTNARSDEPQPVRLRMA